LFVGDFFSRVARGKLAEAGVPIVLLITMFWLLLLFAVAAVAVSADSLLDALTHFFAAAAYSLAEFLPCGDGFALLYFVAESLATFPDILPSGLKAASYRLLVHSELACGLRIEVLGDRQILGFLILADRPSRLGTQVAVDLPWIVSLVA
jgi:hypothetical protein